MLYLPGKRHAYADYQPYVNQRMMEYFAENLLGDYQPGRTSKKMPRPTCGSDFAAYRNGTKAALWSAGAFSRFMVTSKWEQAPALQTLPISRKSFDDEYT